MLENEAAAKRRRDIPLPPAYGNLDDEDRFPPCSVHEDGGALEVAHLKRETRRNFDKILTRALNSRLEKTCKLELLLALAGGLSTACDSLQKLLDIAPQVPVSRIRKPLDFGSYIDLQLRSLIDSLRDSKRGDASISGDFDSIKCKHPRIIERILERPSHTYLPGYAIIQKDGSAPYVADRIAKLLLELLWCCVAACEVRPGPGTLTPSTARTDALMASIMLIFVKVDSVLVQALQLAFSRGITTSKLQYHLTQLDRLNAIFEAELYEQVASRHFFAKAIAWLNEQVEKIRSMSEIETFKLAHPEIFGDGDGDDDDDDVSSRWQGSDNSAEEAVDVEEGEYEHWSRVTTRTSTGMEVKNGTRRDCFFFARYRQHVLRLLIPNRIRITEQGYLHIGKAQKPCNKQFSIDSHRCVVRRCTANESLNALTLTTSTPPQSALRQHPKNPSLLLFFFFNCSSVGGEGSTFCTFSGYAC